MAELNFTLELSALPNGKYRLTAHSPLGQTSVDVDPPFTDEEIDQYNAIFGRRRRVTPTVEGQTAVEFGSRLFNFLIRSHAEINAAYFASLDRAGNDGLRIRLSVDNAGTLRLIPWEFIRDPQRDFLALSRSTPVVRYNPQLSIRPPVPITLPLRVLVMIASPADHPKLDVEGEWQRLQEATADLQARGMVEVVRLESATLIALQRRLRREVFHVFHFVGHSEYDELAGQGNLVFESETDPAKSQIVSGAALGRELGEETSIRLVVLNSCQSGHPAERDSLAGITSNLVMRGIPAVVGMQFAITDGSAKVFSEEFYRALSELMPIDTAVSEARRAIANRRGNTEWATPVLYLRAENGYLFQNVPQEVGVPALPIEPPVGSARSYTTSVNPLVWVVGGGLLLLLVAAVVIGLLRPGDPPLPTATPASVVPPTPAALPDLQIGRVRIAPSDPAPGEIFTVSIAITNVGSADSGAFNWGWDASVTAPVQQNSQVGRVDNIPPGVTKNIGFPFSYGWWATYSSQLVVDIDSEVIENDERNNRLPFDITIADLPFDIDFTLLPNNVIAQPPIPLGSDEFVPWDMRFEVNPLDHEECADVPLLLTEREQDIVLTLATEGFPPVCADLPISIIVFRRQVSDALAEVIAERAGEAVLTFFSDANGQTVVFQSPPLPVGAGETVSISPGDGQLRAIRRIDVQTPGQTVILTRLVLSPPVR